MARLRFVNGQVTHNLGVDPDGAGGRGNVQQLKLWHPAVLAYLLMMAPLLGGFMTLLTTFSVAALATPPSLRGNPRM